MLASTNPQSKTTLQANAWNQNPLLDSQSTDTLSLRQSKAYESSLLYEDTKSPVEPDLEDPTFCSNPSGRTLDIRRTRLHDSYAESEIVRETQTGPRVADPHNPKSGPISLKLALSKTMFVAGLQDISGNLVLTCKSGSRVKIGKIHVSVEGIEEILDDKGRKSTIRQFYQHSVILQSHSTAPSDAVTPNTPDEHGMFSALKRTTTIPFRVPTKSTHAMPPSYWSDKIGGVRWVFTAFAEIKICHQRVPALCVSRDLFVLDHAGNTELTPGIAHTSATASRHISKWLKGSGEIRVSGTLFQTDTTLAAWTAGSVGFVSLKISNASPSPVKKVVLGLYRRFKTFEFTNSLDQVLRPRSFSRVLVDGSSVEFSRRRNVMWWAEGVKGKRMRGWETIGAGCGSELVVDVPVPEGLKSVSSGVLIDVSFVLKVSVFPDGWYVCPNSNIQYSDPVEIEIPIEIRHPVTLMPDLPKLLSNEPTRLFMDRQVVLEPMQENFQLKAAPRERIIHSIENAHDVLVVDDVPSTSPVESTVAAAAEYSTIQRDPEFQRPSRPQTPSIFELKLPSTPDRSSPNKISRTPSIDYGSPASRSHRSPAHQPTREYIPFILGAGSSPNRTQSAQHWPPLSNTAINTERDISDDWQTKLSELENRQGLGGSLRSKRLYKRSSVPIPQAEAPVLAPPATVLRRKKTISRQISMQTPAPRSESGRRSGFEIDRMIEQSRHLDDVEVIAGDVMADEFRVRESFSEMDAMLATMQ